MELTSYCDLVIEFEMTFTTVFSFASYCDLVVEFETTFEDV